MFVLNLLQSNVTQCNLAIIIAFSFGEEFNKSCALVPKSTVLKYFSIFKCSFNLMVCHKIPSCVKFQTILHLLFVMLKL